MGTARKREKGRRIGKFSYKVENKIRSMSKNLKKVKSGNYNGGTTSREYYTDKKYVNVLLDTNILHRIINNDFDLVRKIKCFFKKEFRFMILRNVLKEWKNMETKKFDGKSNNKEIRKESDIIPILQKYTRVQVVETKDEQRLVNSVNRFYNEKKYLHKKTDEPLSKVDCFLLKFALTYGYGLVTTDTLLIHALIKENRYGRRVSAFNPDFYVLSQIDGRYSIKKLA